MLDEGYVKINIPEILAPAGTFEAVMAAVKAGADAVYLGGDLFSARAFAGNFTKDKLIEAIDYCHLYGVKVYMAVNTLLKEDEIFYADCNNRCENGRYADNNVEAGYKNDDNHHYIKCYQDNNSRTSCGNVDGGRHDAGAITEITAENVSEGLKDSLQRNKLVEYIEPFYHEGVDGIIVQDVGVASVLKRNFPDLPLHGSTQMSISSHYGAGLLKNFGFTRVVPARELSLEEIKSIKEKVDIEIETFVHGAMCFSYSGKCLLSSFSGGRSGNRGRCAQPCRQCYELMQMDGSQPENINCRRNYGNTGSFFCSDRDGEAKLITKEYVMSLKDMCTLEILPELIDAGIDSFKIEGRMKKPEYVAATVNAYKKARDFYIGQRIELSKFDDYADVCYGQSHYDFVNWDEDDKQKYYDFVAPLIDGMKDIYNRGGFHTGYYKTDKGPVMFACKRPNHDGLRIGNVAGVSGPNVKIRLEKDVNPGDVIEIRSYGMTDKHSNKSCYESEFSYYKSRNFDNNKKDSKKIKSERQGFKNKEICCYGQKKDDNNYMLDGGSGTKEQSDILQVIELTCNVPGKAGESITLKGKDLKKIKPGMEVYRTRNAALLDIINREILVPEKTVNASAFISARVGKPLSITISTYDVLNKIKTGNGLEKNGNKPGIKASFIKGIYLEEGFAGTGTKETKVNIFKNDNFKTVKGRPICVTVEGRIVEQAANNPTTAEQLLDKIKKTGGTGVLLEATCDIDTNSFVSMREFNDLRHRAVEEFKKKILEQYYR